MGIELGLKRPELRLGGQLRDLPLFELLLGLLVHDPEGVDTTREHRRDRFEWQQIVL